LLVFRVAFHRLDQVRNQIIPPLQLHIDLSPRLIDPISILDEPVVHRKIDEYEHDNRYNRNNPPHVGTSFLHFLLY
jgi:hypothetical protein